MNVLTDLVFNGNKIIDVAIDPLASDPNTGAWGVSEKGRFWYNTAEDIFKAWNGSAIIAFPTLAQLNAAIEGLAWKDSVVVASTVNMIVASDLNVGDTIDGVTLSDGDRVLLKDQTALAENGIYFAGASPVRASDMNLSSEFNGAVVPVQEGGTVNGGTNWRCTTLNPTVDTSDIVFENFGNTVPNASETVKGIVELSTQAEAEAKSSTVHAVTPSALVNFSMKYAADIAASSGATITAATHGLGSSKAKIVQIYSDGTPNELIMADISVADNGDVTWSTTDSISGHIVIVG